MYATAAATRMTEAKKKPHIAVERAQYWAPRGRQGPTVARGRYLSPLFSRGPVAHS